MNLLYIGTVFLGSHAQQLRLIFDTGSSWLVVEDVKCKTCVSTRFNARASTSFRIVNETLLTLRYGRSQLEGYRGADTCGLDR